jgi:predicted RND superfamily exporter protein
MVLKIENLFFKYRLSILSAFVLLTIVMGFFASQLKLDAGFYKQLPSNHSFIKTFYQYEDALFGSNNLIIAVRNTEGDIFEKDFLSKLLEVSEAVRYLPGANQASLTSLWTPNVRVLRVTEEGYEASPVIPGNIIPEDLNDEEIEKIKERILTGGHVGKIVSNDFTSALIKIELTEFDARTGEALDYIELGKLLDVEVRNQFEDEKFQIHIIGFAKMISDIASQAGNVFIFFLLAFALTVSISLLLFKILDTNIFTTNLLTNITDMAIWNVRNLRFWLRPACNFSSIFSLCNWCFSWNSTSKPNYKRNY